MFIAALDTETTGLTLRHGCRPFMVTAATSDCNLHCWEWEVDPVSRNVSPKKSDIKKIEEIINDASHLIFHNAKYDTLGLVLSGVRLPSNYWEKVQDTCIASHSLASGEPHGLKRLAKQYLDLADDDEQELHTAVVEARRKARVLYPSWRIAKENDPHWPGLSSLPGSTEFDEKGSWWKCDFWLPSAIAKHQFKKDPKHPWHSVCRKYGVRDAERTLALWYVFEEALKQEDLWEQYLVRCNLLEITYDMESRGISFKEDRRRTLYEMYSEGAKTAERRCINRMEGRLTNLKSPKQLQAAVYTDLGCTPAKFSRKSGNPSLDKDAVEHLLLTLDPRSKAYGFLSDLSAFRKQGKAAEALESYKFAAIDSRLYPNFNVTGSATTRLSSSNPNGQNISKREGFNLRYIFGPETGRVWYSYDYNNIELRIFSFVAGEDSFIKAFNAGESVHLLVAQELFPKEYAWCEKHGVSFKDKYESTLYQWVKNGNFSLIYGAGEAKADATYHLKGAYKRIRKRFKKIDSFMSHMHRQAKTQGYVECLGGYRLQVPSDGPHKAVNYFVQGSAGWAMEMAMCRTYDYLQSNKNTVDCHMCMTIHDELNFDADISTPITVPSTLKLLMEKSGEDFSIPLPVEGSVITERWDKKSKLALTQKA